MLQKLLNLTISPWILLILIRRQVKLIMQKSFSLARKVKVTSIASSTAGTEIQNVKNEKVTWPLQKTIGVKP